MYWQIQTILAELARLLKQQYAQRPRFVLAAGCVAGLLVLKGTGCVATALLSSPPPAAFAFRKVTGAVRYEDDTAIQSSGMLICFIERGSAQSLGCAPIGAGEADFAITVRIATAVGQKENVGVTITSPAGDRLPADIVPVEYAAISSTPLSADLTSGSVELRVRKP